MRVLLAAAAALALCILMGACAGYRFPGGGPPGTGTVTGQVTVIPCGPVEQVNSQPCQGKPVPGIEIVFTSSSNEQVTIKTDSAGDYAVELAAGKWDVNIKGFVRRVSGPSSVTVVAGGKVVANYVLDSGIRVPASTPAA